MNKKKKTLKLETLEVQSFITELDDKRLENIKGGGHQCGEMPTGDSCIGSPTVFTPTRFSQCGCTTF